MIGEVIMKRTVKRALSVLLALVLVATAIVPMANKAEAAAYTGIMRQTEEVYLNYWYGGGTLYAAGCGIFSLCNAVGYVTGYKMDPVEIANWAYANGYFSGDVGTYRDPFYRKAAARYGPTYGFTIDTNGGGGYWGTIYDSRIKNHLMAGGSVVIHVYGHFMALVGYNPSNGLYHLYDCAPRDRRYTLENGGDLWFSAAQLNSGYTNVDWYCLVSGSRPADTQKPVISNVKVSDISSDGYTVSCTVTDNNAVSKVAFPTWTLANGQDDMPGDWSNTQLGTKNGNTYTFRVKTSAHNNEEGYYVTHIYAYDAAGNSANTSTDNIELRNDKQKPVISDIKVTDVSSSGYTVCCKVTDDWGVVSVSFPTWTLANGQDDLAKDWGTTQLGTKSGDTYTFRVKASDHNNEKGQYITHIYATDKGGNQINVSAGEVTVMDDETEPVITDVQITDVSAQGYTVTCKVTDNVGVEYVAFPTWTVYDGQDDLIADWGLTQRGTKSGDVYTFRVNAADHNGETGDYATHIYAFDQAGNQACYVLDSLLVVDDTEAPVLTDVVFSNITAQGYTVTCKVTDNYGVDVVAFPTWTAANGQDDLAADFMDTQHGIRQGDTYTFYVYSMDHDFEQGEYVTHIYARDRMGNVSTVSPDPVMVQDPVLIPGKISLNAASVYSMEEAMVLDVKPQTTVQSLLKEFEYEDLKVKDSKGQPVSDSIKVGTGYTVELYDGDILVDAVKLVVLGDLDGNGVVDTTDYMRIKSSLLDGFTLNEVEQKAADVNGDGSVDTTDYMRVKAHFLQTFSIE